MNTMERTLLLDQSEISQLIFRFARALDLQEWELFRSCFMEKIETDYSDFRGTPPTEMKANDFVEERKSALAGIQTQHVSANHIIIIEGDQATCTSCAVIFRHDPKMEGENFFNTHCYYEHTLARTSDGWKISKIRQKVLWSTGNPQVHGFHRSAAPAPERPTKQPQGE